MRISDWSSDVCSADPKAVSRVWPDGRIELVAEMGGGTNGIAIGPDGAAYVCNNGGLEFYREGDALFAGHRPADYVTGSIQRLDIDTGEFTTLYIGCDGRRLKGPTDIVFDDQGDRKRTRLNSSH